MRVLILDIETRPNLGYVWGLWEQNLGLSQVKEWCEVICFAAKWEGQRKQFFYSEWEDGREAMVQAMYDLLDEADAVVTYNGDQFDLKHMNTEMIRQGCGKPSPYKSIDLYKIVKATFKLTSYKLDHVAQFLEVGSKVAHQGFQLWLDVMARDPKALRLMEKYNKGDVTVTEAVFTKLRPWIRVMPHPALYGNTNADCCPGCGGDDLQRRGHAVALMRTYQQYRCNSCGKWSRGNKPIDKATLRGI